MHETLTLRSANRGAITVVGMVLWGRRGYIYRSGGFLLYVLTLDAALLFDSGEPDVRDSWFPGYAWRIAYCSNCMHHLGWRYSATQPGQHPRAFWGIRRAVCGMGMGEMVEDHE